MPKHERPEPEDDVDRELMALIDKHGWAVCWVWDDEGKRPGFHYSAGLYELTGKPELLIGGLSRKAGHWLVNAYAKRVVAGESLAAGQRDGDFLDGTEVIFLEVNSRQVSQEYTTWTDWFYRRQDIPLLQLVWPDRSAGAFPWQPEWPARLKDAQEILGQMPSAPI